MRSLIFLYQMATASARFVVLSMSSPLPFYKYSVVRWHSIQLIGLDLLVPVHDAFREAGFLVDNEKCNITLFIPRHADAHVCRSALVVSGSYPSLLRQPAFRYPAGDTVRPWAHSPLHILARLGLVRRF